MTEPSSIISPDDLRPFLPNVPEADLQEWINDAWGIAEQIAPCINSPTFVHRAALKAILRSAIRYNAGAGNGAVTQVSAGSFQKTVDTRQTQSGILFSPAQEKQLSELCRVRVPNYGAYSVPLGTPEQY